jgi:hypothetical protein
MLNLINIGSTVATHRNLVDPIQRTNMRGLMAERFRAFDLHMEGCRFDSRRMLFFILFVSIYFYVANRKVENCDHHFCSKS